MKPKLVNDKPCPDCNGRGIILNRFTCIECNGTGVKQ